MRIIHNHPVIAAGIGVLVVLSVIGQVLVAGDAASRPTAPRPFNLLFIITDQQRWDTLSRAGNRVLRTPNLDQLAREGAYFENAFTACPVCAPARVTMLTGYGIQASGIRTNNVSVESTCPMPTFDDLLAGRGYWTEYFFMVRTKDFKFLFSRSPESRTLDALYHVTEDPFERTNLIGRNPRRAEWLKQAEGMKKRLVEWLEATGSPFLDGVKKRPIS